MPIPHRIAPLTAPPCRGTVSCRISPDFSGLSVCAGQVAYALLTRAPVAGRREQALSPDAPRLACVRPVASVHPEPGSNSPLFVFFFEFVSSVYTVHCRLSDVWPVYRCFGFDKEACHVYDPSLVLLIVYCKYFKVLCLSPRVSGWRKNDAKLKLIFQTTKLFWGNFCFYF